MLLFDFCICGSAVATHRTLKPDGNSQLVSLAQAGQEISKDTIAHAGSFHTDLLVNFNGIFSEERKLLADVLFPLTNFRFG